MSLADYQKQIDDSVQGLVKPYWSPLSCVAHIAEEAGEIARVINHQYGDKPKKPTEKHNLLEDELADLIYSILCLANREGIKLDAAMQRAIDKLTTRDKDRFEKAK